MNVIILLGVVLLAFVGTSKATGETESLISVATYARNDHLPVGEQRSQGCNSVNGYRCCEDAVRDSNNPVAQNVNLNGRSNGDNGLPGFHHDKDGQASHAEHLSSNNMILTQYWSADNIEAAAAAIAAGDVVGFPTETVYGAGANAFSDVAVKKIFIAKGRPSDNPLIVHVPTYEKALALVEINSETLQADIDQLAASFWPGPLTIILPKSAPLSPLVTAGLPTIAIRIPDHPIALALLQCCNVPVAAPSANLSGRPSPTHASHVHHDLDGRIAGVIDGGSTGVGLESTVIDCSSSPYTVLRPGGITLEQIQHVLGDERVRSRMHSNDVATPKAPGMKYQHYAPSMAMYYVKGDQTVLERYIGEQTQAGRRVGVLIPGGSEFTPKANIKVIECGIKHDIQSIAHDLYACLRRFDEDASDLVDVIYAHGFPNEGLGEAVMNRLLKASSAIIE